MVRIRLSIAITEQEVISSSLHWVSFMLHTIPAADQAVRKRNIRQESNILTYIERLELSGDWSIPGNIGWCRRRRE